MLSSPGRAAAGEEERVWLRDWQALEAELGSSWGKPTCWGPPGPGQGERGGRTGVEPCPGQEKRAKPWPTPGTALGGGLRAWCPNPWLLGAGVRMWVGSAAKRCPPHLGVICTGCPPPPPHQLWLTGTGVGNEVGGEG